MRIGLVLVLAGCSSRPAVPREPLGSRPVVRVDGGSAGRATDAAADSEDYVHQPGTEPARAALAMTSARPFELRPAQLATLLRSTKDGYRVDNFVPAFGAKVMLVGPSLFDVTSRRATPIRGKLVATSPANHAFVVEDGVQRLLRADDGRVLEPRIAIPDGKVTEWQLAALATSDVIWVFARGSTGRTFHGRWTDPRDAKVALSDELPFWPDYVRAEPDYIAIGGDPKCDHGSIVDPGPRRCEPADANGYVGADRWIDGPELVDPAGKRERLMVGCPPKAVAIVAQHPATGRVLSMCPLAGTAQPFELLAPAGRWAWWEDELGAAGGDLVEPGSPIVPLERAVDRDRPVTRWLDVEHATVFTSPPLVPLEPPRRAAPDGSYHEIGSRHLIAHAPDNAYDLWHVDLEHGSLDHIGVLDACAEGVTVTDLVGSRVLLDCAQLDGAGDRVNAETGARDTYMELVDLATRTRWHAANVLGGKIVPGGAVGTHTVWESHDYLKQRGAKLRPPKAPFSSQVVQLVAP